MATAASSGADWRAHFLDLFRDPISFETMTHPVTLDPCGHVFEKTEIEGWRAQCISNGAPPSCPLCKMQIAKTIEAFLIKRALEVLSAPSTLSTRTIDALVDEDREELCAGARHIEERRSRDTAAGIPHFLDKAVSFAKKVVAASSNAYNSC